MRWNLARTTGTTDTWQARKGAVLIEIDSPRTPGASHNWRVFVGGEHYNEGTEDTLDEARARTERWAASVSA